jgi:hypothetical protein
MTDDTQDDGSGALTRGLDAVVVAEAARELNDAVDAGAIDGQGEVDYDQLAEALARPIGRLVARELVDDTGTTGLAKRMVTDRLGRKMSEATFRIVVENVDTGALTETLVRLDEETLPGPSLSEYVESEVLTDGERSSER